MKKLSLFVAILMVIGLASFAYAENSASAMSGKLWAEQQVFIQCYNNSGTDITSNQVVILDTTATNAASYSTLGACITTATTTGSALTIGVTDEIIADGRAGRVCVRGPHKVQMLPSGGSFTAGATVTTTTTAGHAFQSLGESGRVTVLGTLLSATATQDSSILSRSAAYECPRLYWIWVNVM